MRFPFTGVIPVDKPSGTTSRRVVDAVARALGLRAVGHAGTLDPLAAGVVVVCVGHATRLVDFLHELPKRYRASFLLGRSSPSDDLETEVTPEPEPVRPTAAALAAALPAFRGAIRQRPCDFSAVHVAGKRAYRLARRGAELDLPEKAVQVHRLDVTAYDWPRLELAIECSSGTFVRALGRDLAAALGTRAVMEALVRDAVGPFVREASLPLDAVDPAGARAALLPPLAALPHLERVVLAADELASAACGGLVTPAGAAADAIAALDPDGALVGVLRRHDAGGWRLRPNFRGVG